MADLTETKRENLARRIAFLETDIGTMTLAQECARLGKLDALRAEYGEEDDQLRAAIAKHQRQVEQAQRYGEYD